MMMQAVITSGVTADNVVALEKLADLYERNERRQAEKDFAGALAALQGETIRVAATQPVHGKDGSLRYHFAPYEEIMGICQPILSRHGFSVTFDTEIDSQGERLTSICTLTHSGGHSRSNRFSVRFTTPPGASISQGDMSTKSYAKRGALCDALNIVVDHDDDARMVGAPVANDIAAELERRVKECGADEEAFLRFAGAQTYAEIPSDRYDKLDAILTRKEMQRQEEARPRQEEARPSAPPPEEFPPEKRDADGNFLW